MKKHQRLQQATFAGKEEEALIPLSGKQKLKMHNSDATALPLVLDDSGKKPFGADLIRFPAGGGVDLHTHEGAHILMVIGGRGKLTYFEETHEMFPGMIYLVPSRVPHAILASSELVLVAIGNDQRSAESSERLKIITKKE